VGLTRMSKKRPRGTRKRVLRKQGEHRQVKKQKRRREKEEKGSRRR